MSQLLYTGTDVGKEGSARVIRMLGSEEGNRAAIMRARAVEPLVELIQTGCSGRCRDEASGALMALSNQGGAPTPQAVVQQASGQTSAGWFGMFGSAAASGAASSSILAPSASAGSYGDNEAVTGATVA